MEWIRLKEIGMKNSHIKKIMAVFQNYEELFSEENFKLFSDDLKRKLEEAQKINLEERLALYRRNKVRIVSVNDVEYPKRLKEIKEFPVFLYLKGKKIKEEKKYGTKTINPVHVSNFVEMKRKCRTKLVNRVQLCM